MTQNISGQAATAREQSRKKDGKFGNQPHDRAEGIELSQEAAPEQRTATERGRAFHERARELGVIANQQMCEEVLVTLASRIRENEPDVAYIAVSKEYDDGGDAYPELIALDKDRQRLGWDTGHDALADDLSDVCGDLDYETMMWNLGGVAPYAMEDNQDPELRAVWSAQQLADGPPRKHRAAALRKQRQLMARAEIATRAESANLAVEDMAAKVRQRHPQARSIALVEDSRHETVQYLTALDAEGRDLYEHDEEGRHLDVQYVADDYSLSADDLESAMTGNAFRGFAANGHSTAVLSVYDFPEED